MFRNLDEFSAALTKATTEATQAAATSANTRAIVQAAQSGDQATVARIANNMTTAELKAVEKHLKR